MKKNILLAITAAGLIFVAACKKDSGGGSSGNGNIDITGKSKRDIFKMQAWKFNDWSDSAENDDVWDNNADNYQLDDIYTFKSNSEISINDGTLKNPAATTNPYTENWSMDSDNATTVNLIGLTWDIKSQTSTKMVMWRKTNDGTMNHYQRLIFVKP